jgi:hypothetical protein
MPPTPNAPKGDPTPTRGGPAGGRRLAPPGVHGRTVRTKTTRRYKLLAGQHQQADPDWEPSERELKIAERTGIPPRAPTRTYSAGDVIESDNDLVEKLGNGKFAYVGPPPNKTTSVRPPLTDDDNRARVDEDARAKDHDGDQPPQPLADPTHMTVAELRDLAETEEVDLAGAKTKSEIIEAIDRKRKADARKAAKARRDAQSQTMTGEDDGDEEPTDLSDSGEDD